MGPEKREHIVALYKFDAPRDAQDFSELLQGFNVILKVLSSWRRKVNIEAFEILVKKNSL